MRRIVYATGSRADYGIVRRYLALLGNDPGVNLSLWVTGALLDGRYGHQVDLIREDGFRIGAEIPLPLDTSSDRSVLHAMARALDGFARCVDEERPDLLVVLGDRYEILPAALAAAMQRVPVLHLHGGEATYANYDEFIRHSITKMARWHFTATEEYRRRVIQLGEDPSRVFCLGALGAENCLEVDEEAVSPEVRELPRRGYFVVLFHPETISGADPADQAREVLAAASRFPGVRFVFLGSNADSHADEVRRLVRERADEDASSLYFESLRTNDYHWLVRNSIALVGNSSSGLIEAPSLGARTVNIGHRQDGRVRGGSVIDVECRADEIEAAMRAAMDEPDASRWPNPYFRPGAAKAYCAKTLEIISLLPVEGAKEFYDVDFDVDGQGALGA